MTGIEGVDEGHISISNNQEVSYLEQHSLVETTETTDFGKIMTRYGNLQEVFMEKMVML